MPKKEIDETLAGIIHYLWHALKVSGLEIEAYKGAIEQIIGTKNPEVVESLNAYVALQRQSSVLQAEINKRYAPVLETLLSSLSDEPHPINLILERLHKLENLSGLSDRS